MTLKDYKPTYSKMPVFGTSKRREVQRTALDNLINKYKDTPLAYNYESGGGNITYLELRQLLRRLGHRSFFICLGDDKVSNIELVDSEMGKQPMLEIKSGGHLMMTIDPVSRQEVVDGTDIAVGSLK